MPVGSVSAYLESWALVSLKCPFLPLEQRCKGHSELEGFAWPCDFHVKDSHLPLGLGSIE